MSTSLEPLETTVDAQEIQHKINELHPTILPETAFSRVVDSALKTLGEIVSWVWLPLVFIVILNVVMRYVFSQGRIEFEELQWHLYAIGFMFGLSYCYALDAHVRIDVAYEHFSLTLKTWFEIIGMFIFLIPFIGLIIIYAYPFVYDSFITHEVSQAPGGLPYRWAIKSVLLIAFILLAIAVLSRLSRCTAFLFGFPKPISAAK